MHLSIRTRWRAEEPTGRENRHTWQATVRLTDLSPTHCSAIDRLAHAGVVVLEALDVVLVEVAERQLDEERDAVLGVADAVNHAAGNPDAIPSRDLAFLAVGLDDQAVVHDVPPLITHLVALQRESSPRVNRENLDADLLVEG
jgi:hypothetical protein